MDTRSDCIDVAVGVIINPENEVLLTQRPDHVHQGGLWEFPGGKCKADESIMETLVRELKEEVGIDVVRADPLIQIQHNYPDCVVNLQVYKIVAYEGIAHSQEGQTMRWVSMTTLKNIAMPAANAAIVQAVLLPDIYLITPDPEDFDIYLQTLQSCLQSGIRMIQYRDKSASDSLYQQRLNAILQLSRPARARVLVNHSLAMFERSDADGLHLTAGQLLELDSRPVGNEYLLSASCHNLEEIQHANKIGADLILLSPVLPTLSHPGATALGWEKAQQLIKQAHMPVYALGGLQPGDIQQARMHGAQGVAGIRSIWRSCQ